MPRSHGVGSSADTPNVELRSRKTACGVIRRSVPENRRPRSQQFETVAPRNAAPERIRKQDGLRRLDSGQSDSGRRQQIMRATVSEQHSRYLVACTRVGLGRGPRRYSQAQIRNRYGQWEMRIPPARPGTKPRASDTPNDANGEADANRESRNDGPPVHPVLIFHQT